MTCRLCLRSANYLINIFDASAADLKAMVATVSKFIGVQLSATDSSKVCFSCWASVYNLQKFCRFVEQQQLDLKLPDTAEEQKQIFAAAEAAETHFGHEIKMDIEMKMAVINDEIQEDDAGSTAENIKDMLYCETETEQIVQIEKETKEAVVNLVDEVRELPQKTASLEEVKEDAAVQIFLGADQQLQEVQSKDLHEKLAKTTNESKNSKVLKETSASSSSSLYKHEANAHKISQSVKKAEEDNRLIARHMKLKCDLCQSTASNFEALMKHFKMTHRISGYAVCCRKRLYKRCLLIDHINVHKNPEYFKCEHCAKILQDRDGLRKHTLQMHPSEAELLYNCEHCSKKFVKEYLLQRHAIMHMPHEERTHYCNSCHKAFQTVSRLRIHQKNVHGDGNLRACKHCGKFLRGKIAFKRHIKEHERPGGVSERRVQCEVCAARLPDSNCLREHMKQHTQETSRSFSCEMCGTVAPSRVDLNAHWRYQHGTQPEQLCEHRERTF